ncbi:MAG: ATP-binding cassette domain-containing protein [Acidimicrobiaceae bacterium]|nr:ATP-binding cassette domain-containing protein [Acidimicrobiaceae bacterium]
MESARPLLELKSISKRFSGVIVADDLSFTVGVGESLGIVGPNGAGKTTLFGMIGGDIKADRGEVRLDTRLLNGMDSAERARAGIGRTYQVPRSFEQMTVFENVLVAAQHGAGLRGRSAHEMAQGVISATGLQRSINRPAGRLGLLDRKRLELAKALATSPKVLLLDEVAGGLTDPEVDELIGVVSESRGAGVSIIWIEHVVRALVETMERLICFAGGRIVGDGRPLDVLAMDAVRELFLGSEPGDERYLHGPKPMTGGVEGAKAGDGSETEHG